MAYKIRFKLNSQWEFEHLSQGRKKAIANKIDELVNNAHPPGAVNLKNYPTLWRLTAKDVRAIYHEPINSDIYILRVATRDVAYTGLMELLFPE